MQKNWNISCPDIGLTERLSTELNKSHLFTGLLVNRGLNSKKAIEHFINCDLSILHDPFKLPDMDVSVRRIKKAVRTKEKVLIFGDYDVDGLTSIALLKNVLNKLGLETLHYLPHRLKEGYGLNKEAIKYAVSKGVSLLITLDCGTSSFDEVEILKKNKIDVIIVDHHTPLENKLPRALAIINPKRQDSCYPYSELAAVGVVFKLAQGLLGEVPEDELDLVCLGTVADVAPLNGENRVIVKHGLEVLSQTKKPGLKALIDVARIKDKKITTGFINYILGPRINATGRMATSQISLDLLMSNDLDEALKLAQELDRYNKMRQQVEAQILEEALAKVQREINFKDHFVIVLSSQNWHQGVSGIVASKIAERFSRPTIIISVEEGVGKGSARSSGDFHILEAISGCDKFLISFGGHKHAAGVVIKENKIKDFSLAINDFARKNFKPENFLTTVDIDKEAALKDLNLDLVEDIQSLAPFGEGNERPVFCSFNLKIKDRPVILGRDTLKFWASDGKFTYQAVGFGMAGYSQLITDTDGIDIAYRVSLDNWQGRRELQLDIEDIRVSA